MFKNMVHLHMTVKCILQYVQVGAFHYSFWEFILGEASTHEEELALAVHA